MKLDSPGLRYNESHYERNQCSGLYSKFNILIPDSPIKLIEHLTKWDVNWSAYSLIDPMLSSRNVCPLLVLSIQYSSLPPTRVMLVMLNASGKT